MAKKIKDNLQILDVTVNEECEKKKINMPQSSDERLTAFKEVCKSMGISRRRCPAGQLIA